MTAPAQDQQPPQAEQQPPPARDDAPPPDKQEPDWKAEARKWEARAKENSTAAQKLADIEEQSKTDLQKAIERAEAAERKASESDAARLRSDIARELGVPPRFVVGSSEDEMREAAQEYLADREQAQQDKARRADVDQGARPDQTVRQLSRSDLASMSPAQIAAAKKEGRLSSLLAGT